VNINDLPLSGVHVIELTTYVAAPTCGRMFADWGADVIKVEAPSGDYFRSYGEVVKTSMNEEENPLWDLMHANKRGIVVDLKDAKAREILYKLLDGADVFLTNVRPAALQKLDLDYETLEKRFPRLVYGLVTGLGEGGPDADLPGFDVTAYWARSGFIVDLVNPDAYPVYPPAAFGDVSVGTTLFGGVCAALRKAEKTGRGDKISISLYGTAIWFASICIVSTQERYGNAYPKTRLEGHPLAIPYKCKDDEWVTTSVLDIKAQWPIFCEAINHPELINDPRFKTVAEWLKHKADLIGILEPVFLTKSRDEWIDIFRKVGIVVERLNHFKDITKDPQAWANNYLRNHTFANGEQAALTCTPLRSAHTETVPFKGGPLLGEHTKEILEELGYSAAEIEEMKQAKKILIR
jgi:(R)-2-hydroxy-4-methylpentanoate CoA-transferase